MADYSAQVVPLKLIAAFPGWSDPEPETSYSWFNAPLEIGGVIEPGLMLHGGCYIDQPNRHVSLELHIAKTPGRQMRPLERIDWRSNKGGHTNVVRSGMPQVPPRVSSTHLHAFELNWEAGKLRMRGPDLPYACEIAEDLSDFETLRAYAGKRLRISNINLVSTPAWEYALDLNPR